MVERIDTAALREEAERFDAMMIDSARVKALCAEVEALREEGDEWKEACEDARALLSSLQIELSQARRERDDALARLAEKVNKHESALRERDEWKAAHDTRESTERHLREMLDEEKKKSRQHACDMDRWKTQSRLAEASEEDLKRQLAEAVAVNTAQRIAMIGSVEKLVAKADERETVIRQLKRLVLRLGPNWGDEIDRLLDHVGTIERERDEARAQVAKLLDEARGWRKSVWYPLRDLLVDTAGIPEGGASYVEMMRSVATRLAALEKVRAAGERLLTLQRERGQSAEIAEAHSALDAAIEEARDV